MHKQKKKTLRLRARRKNKIIKRRISCAFTAASTPRQSFYELLWMSLKNHFLLTTVKHAFELEVYIGSDINGQPNPTKYPTNPNTTRYPNGENRTTRTRPNSELPNSNPTRHEVSNWISWPTTRRMHPFYNLNFTILILQSYTDCRKSLHVQ